MQGQDDIDRSHSVRFMIFSSAEFRTLIVLPVPPLAGRSPSEGQWLLFLFHSLRFRIGFFYLFEAGAKVWVFRLHSDPRHDANVKSDGVENKKCRHPSYGFFVFQA